ncbi:putative ribonuclease H-like domain-containing protein [Tanacetum coccineum]
MTTLGVDCQKGKANKASCKAIFSWTFFLRSKDETSAILKDFIRQIENQLNQKVKTIRCDNGTEFKNRDINEFCGLKGIKREYSNARTPQQMELLRERTGPLLRQQEPCLQIHFYLTLFGLKHSENQANIHAGQQATNQNEGSKDKLNSGEFSNRNEKRSKSKRGEVQVFLDDLARLQRQERFQKLRKMKVGLMLCKKKLLQFEIQKVLFLSRFAFMEEGYGTKWGIGNKKDEEEWLSGTKAD